MVIKNIKLTNVVGVHDDLALWVLLAVTAFSDLAPVSMFAYLCNSELLNFFGTRMDILILEVYYDIVKWLVLLFCFLKRG